MGYPAVGPQGRVHLRAVMFKTVASHWFTHVFGPAFLIKFYRITFLKERIFKSWLLAHLFPIILKIQKSWCKKTTQRVP